MLPILAFTALSTASVQLDTELARHESRIVVRLAPGSDPTTVARRAGLVLRSATPNAPFAVFAVVKGTPSAARERLRADRQNVRWAHVDAYRQRTETLSKGSSLSVIGTMANVQQRNDSSMSQINWSSTLAGSTGRTVKVGIVDTGLSRKQTSLWGYVDAYYDAFGGNGDDQPSNLDSSGNGVVDEGAGHGTMVAGLINTVAPKVRLVVARVADSDGLGSSWNVVQGITYAVNQGAEVINLSMGSTDDMSDVEDAIAWAKGQGVLVVAAIGNSGASQAMYPARNPNTLCVTGLNSDNTKASFSNYDPISIGACPAVGVTSQYYDGTMGVWSGTSCAAPFVTASVADCLRRTTRRTPASLIQAVSASGQIIDGVNASYSGRLGKLLNFTSLDGYLQGHP